MPNTPDQQLSELVKRFISDLSSVVRDAALASFTAALELRTELGGPGGGESERGRGAAKAGTTGRRPAKAASARAVGRKAKSASAKGSRAIGGKRDPKLVEELTERLAAHVANHAGHDIREIGEALGASTGELALPVKRLLAAKTIKKRGNRRSTRYFKA